MPRRTKAVAAATREGLLDAAELCFLEMGVFRTTLEHIAARAGFTKGAIYWHFRNKYEVLVAMLDRIEMPLYTDLEALAAGSTDRPLRSLLEFYREELGRLGRNVHPRNAIVISQLRCELVDDTRPVFDRMRRMTGALLATELEIFRRAHRLGHLRTGLDPARCAQLMHFVVQGALREWVLDPLAVQIQRDGIAAVETGLASVAADPALLADPPSCDATTPAKPARRSRPRKVPS